MIDLGIARKQREIVAGPIPPRSLVRVKLKIRKPKKADPNNEAITVYSTGLLGLDMEMTVTDGQYEGVKIWENWFLHPELQKISLTKGQEGVCQDGFAKCRAAIEATRRLDPDDPNANRKIQSLFDLHGLEVPVKVGIDTPKPGGQYINNKILQILTINDENFENIMGGGEVISNEPIPKIPESNEKAGNESESEGESRDWRQRQASNQGENGKNPLPDWTQKGN